LKLDDEAVRVAVGLRLGLNLCVPHQCRCGAPVDASGLHIFVCKQAPGKTPRHHDLNDVVARAFAAAGIPVCKEPTGLSLTDGKLPDGMTLIPWCNDLMMGFVIHVSFTYFLTVFLLLRQTMLKLDK